MGRGVGDFERKRERGLHELRQKVLPLAFLRNQVCMFREEGCRKGCCSPTVLRNQAREPRGVRGEVPFW